MHFWTVLKNHNLGTYAERLTHTISLPVVNDPETLTVISGTIPPGMRLKGYELVGTPFEVKRTEEFVFVVRAKKGASIEDKTLRIFIEGSDEPQWITPQGDLPLGTNGQYFILDSQLVDFQLNVIDPDIPAGEELEFYIADGDGELPKGIELTKDGKLYGIVEPLLALEKRVSSGFYDKNDLDSAPYDFGLKSANGFDSFFYDTTIYDYSIGTRSPKKLNRFYEFTVTVSDGITASKRKFKIYLVGDDFLRTDNTIMQIATGLFTADVDNLRKATWLTPGDLGFRRANNFVTLYLDAYDPNPTQGALSYLLESENPDGSPSVIPPGLSLDSTTGEIAGRVPYQPAVTREFKFTINALKQAGAENVGFAEFQSYQNADIIAGQKFIPITKIINQLTLESIPILSSASQVYESVIATQSLIANDVLELTNPITSKDFLTVVRAEAGSDKIRTNKATNTTARGIYWDGQDEISWSGVTNGTESSAEFFIKDTHSIQEIQARLQQDNTYYNLIVSEGRVVSETVIPQGSDTIYRLEWSGIADRNALTNATNSWLALLRATNDLDNSNDWQVTLSNSTFTEFGEIALTKNLPARIEPGTKIYYGIAIKGDTEFKVAIGLDQYQTASNKKTFTVRLLGEIESTITWLTPSDLGNIRANFVSTLAVQAQTTVPNAKLYYTLESGKLPPGLRLSVDGELVGKIRQFPSETQPGLTVFDNKATTFDGATTSIDRVYTFSIKAQDQFGFSAIEKEFIVSALDPDDKLYSNLYLKPYLKSNQKVNFVQFVSDPNIFDPNYIYRPQDPQFGIQQEFRMLAYAGIETKTIKDYATAVALNHKKKKFKLGEIKTAEAKKPGTNDVVYEVVYIDVIDPAQIENRRTRKSIQIQTQNRITVDSVEIESIDDNSGKGTGFSTFQIDLRSGFAEGRASEGSITIYTRLGPVVLLGDSITAELRDASAVAVADIKSSKSAEPYRFRPDWNTIKVDSSINAVSDSKDQKKFISNIGNMQEEISKVGDTEREFLPLWMRTQQNFGEGELGFVTAVPLCYCKPGTSQNIVLNIKNSEFDFKTIEFEADRYIIDSTEGNSEEQYILFGNKQINV